MVMHAKGRRRRWPFAQGSGRYLALTSVLLAVSLVASLLWPSLVTTLVTVLLAVLWGLVMFFFRDPERVPPDGGGQFLSPADGRVVAVLPTVQQRFPGGDTLQVGIFMSILDVHVNRSPIAGRVRSVEHVPGRFLQAFRPEAAEVNEHNFIALQNGPTSVLVKQIAGILARRVVCWAREGDGLEAGQRFGIIMLGSRVDLFLPPDVEVLVKPGDKVRGGQTIVARLRPR